jgi:hypothetical protein
MPNASAKCNLSSESAGVPADQPWIVRLPRINSVVDTSIESVEAPKTTNVPLHPKPFTSADVAFPLGAVRERCGLAPSRSPHRWPGSRPRKAQGVLDRRSRERQARGCRHIYHYPGYCRKISKAGRSRWRQASAAAIVNIVPAACKAADVKLSYVHVAIVVP